VHRTSGARKEEDRTDRERKRKISVRPSVVGRRPEFSTGAGPKQALTLNLQAESPVARDAREEKGEQAAGSEIWRMRPRVRGSRGRRLFYPVGSVPSP
jgi:hypothetical protein